MTSPEWVWKNGELVRYSEANIHVSSAAVHFGPVAFEGIRCHPCEEAEGNCFRIHDHIERLQRSARALNLDVPFSTPEVIRACTQVLLANGHLEAYLRPIVFPGSGTLGLGRASGRPAEVCVMTFPWDNGALEKGQKHGIRAHVSSVLRTEAHPRISKSKISANYAASLLALDEARAAGCSEALLLDRTGTIAEASTANVFVVRGSQVLTPPSSLPILDGITRDSVFVLARELGITTVEAPFTVADLASVDEVFLSGTACELLPVRKVNGQKIGGGSPGPVTTTLLKALRAALMGQGADRGWSHIVKGMHAAAQS